MLKVLVAEDSPTALALLLEILKTDPLIEVVGTASNGADAVRMAIALKPDVITLDLEMPRMDGYEFAASLHRSGEFNTIPVVMITSRSAEKHRERAFESGVSRYLTKPYDDKELLSTIRALASIT